MAATTVLIDKLLEACVKQGASDIHITTAKNMARPVIFVPKSIASIFLFLSFSRFILAI